MAEPPEPVRRLSHAPRTHLDLTHFHACPVPEQVEEEHVEPEEEEAEEVVAEEVVADEQVGEEEGVAPGRAAPLVVAPQLRLTYKVHPNPNP